MGLFGLVIGNNMQKTIRFIEVLKPLIAKFTLCCFTAVTVRWFMSGSSIENIPVVPFIGAGIGITSVAIYQWYYQ